MAKRSPTEIIESDEFHHLENIWIKFPGVEIIPIAEKRFQNRVRPDSRLLENLYNKYKKDYTLIHTHPTDSSNIPSLNDYLHFLFDDHYKNMIIVRLNSKRRLEDYTLFRKTKDTLEGVDFYGYGEKLKEHMSKGILKGILEGIKHGIRPYVTSIKLKRNVKKLFNKSPLAIAKKYNLKYIFGSTKPGTDKLRNF